jgi:hypothetical protein
MMVGTLSRDIDHIYAKQVAGTYLRDGRDSAVDSQLADVATYVEEYDNDRLFASMPGRQLVGFENYRSKLKSIESPGLFKARLQTYARNLDRQRNAVLN